MNQLPEIETFIASLKKHPDMDAAYILIPFNVLEVYGTKGQVKVKAWFDGFEYLGSIVPMGGGQHVLGVRKDIRKAIGKTFGDEIEVKLERDLEIRKVQIPEELAFAFKQNPEAKKVFDKLAYTHQREHVTYISEAKKLETQIRRIEKTIERLLMN